MRIHGIYRRPGRLFLPTSSESSSGQNGYLYTSSKLAPSFSLILAPFHAPGNKYTLKIVLFKT